MSFEYTPSTIFVASDHLSQMLVKNGYLRRHQGEDQPDERFAKVRGGREEGAARPAVRGGDTAVGGAPASEGGKEGSREVREGGLASSRAPQQTTCVHA
jgi:hypothetical protein